MAVITPLPDDISGDRIWQRPLHTAQTQVRSQPGSQAVRWAVVGTMV
jgi:hypothetical protein